MIDYKFQLRPGLIFEFDENFVPPKRMKKLSEIKDDKELHAWFDEAQCRGVKQARDVLIAVHKTKAENESDPQKKAFHLAEAERLADDNEWNSAV